MVAIREQTERRAKKLKQCIDEAEELHAKLIRVAEKARRAMFGRGEFFERSTSFLRAAIQEACRDPVFLGTPEALVMTLKVVARHHYRGEWFYPLAGKENLHVHSERCGRLLVLGLVRERPRYCAYKLTKKGERFLEEEKEWRRKKR